MEEIEVTNSLWTMAPTIFNFYACAMAEVDREGQRCGRYWHTNNTSWINNFSIDPPGRLVRHVYTREFVNDMVLMARLREATAIA